MIQRIFDVIFSGCAILILAPLLAPVMLLLCVTGEGEIFYQQERIGKSGRIFRVKKFATMLKNSPSLPGGTVTVKNDPRVLPFGRLLRKSKINELPQLFNIFLGDMSLIGPRPLTIETFGAYSPDVQKMIKSVRPGLSGIGSIVFRNEEVLIDDSEDPKQFYNDIIAPYKGELECWFIKNNSFKLYLILIFVTMFVVLFPRSNIIWHLFCDLPRPSGALKRSFQL